MIGRVARYLVAAHSVAATRAAAFPWLSTTDEDLRRALAIQAQLCQRGGRAVPWPTLIVAAVAERHALPVLHYDLAFPAIAEATGQAAQSVVPEGSVPTRMDEATASYDRLVREDPSAFAEF